MSLEVGDSWFQLEYFKGGDGKPWSTEATAFEANKEVALGFEIGADD